MLGMHLVLRNGAWPLDLIASGADGTFAYGTVFLLAGMTPAERGALMRILGRRPIKDRPGGA
jgi:hypothetical protein